MDLPTPQLFQDVVVRGDDGRPSVVLGDRLYDVALARACGMDNGGADTAGSSSTSSQNDIEIYSGNSQNSNSIAWTDPTTGQGYDMYGNPVYSSGGGSSSSAQIAWTDPTTGQGYDMYGNPVYQ